MVNLHPVKNAQDYLAWIDDNHLHKLPMMSDEYLALMAEFYQENKWSLHTTFALFLLDPESYCEPIGLRLPWQDAVTISVDLDPTDVIGSMNECTRSHDSVEFVRL